MGNVNITGKTSKELTPFQRSKLKYDFNTFFGEFFKVCRTLKSPTHYYVKCQKKSEYFNENFLKDLDF